MLTEVCDLAYADTPAPLPTGLVSELVTGLAR